MRLFVAVNFDDEVKKKILLVQDELRSKALKGNFSRAENFHITLAFLGDLEKSGDKAVDGMSEKLFSIMDEIKAPPFEIRFDKTGCFTHSRKELWWIGADRSSPGFPVLLSIHAQLLSRLLEAGFSIDTRAFNAHITLAREVKHDERITLDKPDIGMKVERISLMNSERIRGVLTYTEIYGKNLG